MHMHGCIPAIAFTQLWLAGSGLHWPSAPHTASCVVFGKSPSAQRNEKVEPAVVLDTGGSTITLSAGVGGPQSTVLVGDILYNI